MAFWGIEVKPGKPYTHKFDTERGRLHLSQATLGNGSSTKKSFLQCKTGDNQPIYLCSLLPDKIETCALNLEFEEEDDVIFSVQGPHTIHLSGFFLGDSKDMAVDAYESDSYGEEISRTESDDASDYDSEAGFEDDSLDGDIDMYPSMTVPKSGVVIEEILDDEKPAIANNHGKHGKKKKQLIASDKNYSEIQQVVKSNSGDDILDSEDEDGFPILFNHKKKSNSSGVEEKLYEVKDHRSDEEAKKKTKDAGSLRTLKRKVQAVVVDKENKSECGQQPETDIKQMKEKKKKKKKTEKKEEAMQLEDESQKQSTKKDLDIDTNYVGEEKNEKEKNKNKKQRNGAVATVDHAVVDKNGAQDKTKGKPIQVRTFPNGLIIEEMSMGKPDGKKASPGKKVSVNYIGTLKKNGEIFDSNVGKAPFMFRLGVGQVIKGWDCGVNGMRVGDKRRLTIPPAMGYGTEGAGQTIPPDSWLVFDVELVAVN